MERVTYPSQEVQDELARRFERVLLDVVEDADAAKAFAPQAIPVAIILDADGVELARHAGFAAPADHATWLKSVAP
jgi:thioredoxin-like negative regulator of GroEL